MKPVSEICCLSRTHRWKRVGPSREAVTVRFLITTPHYVSLTPPPKPERRSLRSMFCAAAGHAATTMRARNAQVAKRAIVCTRVLCEEVWHDSRSKTQSASFRRAEKLRVCWLLIGRRHFYLAKSLPSPARPRRSVSFRARLDRMLFGHMVVGAAAHPSAFASAAGSASFRAEGPRGRAGGTRGSASLSSHGWGKTRGVGRRERRRSGSLLGAAVRKRTAVVSVRAAGAGEWRERHPIGYIPRAMDGGRGAALSALRSWF